MRQAAAAESVHNRQEQRTTHDCGQRTPSADGDELEKAEAKQKQKHQRQQLLYGPLAQRRRHLVESKLKNMKKK